MTNTASPSSGNAGRFQYTGQTWLPELGMYYYKARIYSPTLGRFLQTDPIGYGDGMNLYAYVGGDPVNFSDPFGLKKEPPKARTVCTGTRISSNCGSGGISNGASPGSRLAFGGGTGGLSSQVYTCVQNCGAADVRPGPGGGIDGATFLVTAPIYAWISTSVSFFVRDGRYVYNTNHETPWWSDWFDRGVSVMLAGPGAIALGGEVVALGSLSSVGPGTLTNPQMSAVTKWGSGGPAALARIPQITRAEVAAMRAQGLTKGDVMHFSNLYMRAIQVGRGIGVAGPRYSLMQKILQNW